VPWHRFVIDLAIRYQSGVKPPHSKEALKLTAHSIFLPELNLDKTVLLTQYLVQVDCSFHFDCNDKGKPVVRQGRKAVSLD
jgi:hypothetical protein